MLKKLQKVILGASLSAALLVPNKSNADEFELQEPLELSLHNAGMEFSGYSNIDYGLESGFRLGYNGDLLISYGNLTYNTNEKEEDFIDALVGFAGSNENIPTTPLDNIFNQALQFNIIRRQRIGRFSMEDFSTLFRSFYGTFDDSSINGITQGNANLILKGRIDVQHYSRNYFRSHGQVTFFDHNSQILAYGSGHANMRYLLLENKPINFGTRYDDFIDKRLEMSLSAEFEAEKFIGESYRLGIIDGNSTYGMGILLSRFYHVSGTESANIIVSSELDNLRDGRLAFIDAREDHTIERSGGDEGLAYVFHSGQNGIIWHSAYLGLNIPDNGTLSEVSSSSRFAEIRLTNFTEYSDNYYDYVINSYNSPRLDYGILLGIGPEQFQPVLSASRLRGSRFFFNFMLPYNVFNVSSDLDAPINVFLTTDRNNEQHLARFIRTTEENYSMPVVAVNAMNDSARLAAYQNLDNFVASFSSENGRLSLSALYANRNKFFLEFGGEKTNIGNYGIFMRGGIPGLMATAGYSYNNRVSESYWSNGFVFRITGRSDNLYYNLSTKSMLLNVNKNYLWPNDINDNFRIDLILGANF